MIASIESTPPRPLPTARSFNVIAEPAAASVMIGGVSTSASTLSSQEVQDLQQQNAEMARLLAKRQSGRPDAAHVGLECCGAQSRGDLGGITQEHSWTPSRRG